MRHRSIHAATEKTMLSEREAESCYLGQFIPVHYHHNMLVDENRMANFKAAIEHAVFPGAKVLELGGGTGVLSWFAAARASKVWCVEYNPDLVKESRKFLAQNSNGHKVEVVHADAFDYLPPEPVDVVICEMIHVAMLREKQVQMIESFKRRYLERFGGRLPVFLPEAAIMAVQPLQQAYSFFGYQAPIVQFQAHATSYPGTVELAAPAVYKVLDFAQENDTRIVWEGRLTIQRSGHLNAMRFVTKNVLAVLMGQGTTIDWLNHYMIVPMDVPVDVTAGDRIDIRFEYRAGGTIPSLQHSIQAQFAEQPLILERACA
jgi:type I protein arginine methyltransferase